MALAVHLGVTRTSNPGCRWLILAVVEMDAAARQARGVIQGERERLRQRALEDGRRR